VGIVVLHVYPVVRVHVYLCMQVAALVLHSAQTEVSEDGNLLVEHRFDLDEAGNRY